MNRLISRTCSLLTRDPCYRAARIYGRRYMSRVVHPPPGQEGEHSKWPIYELDESDAKLLEESPPLHEEDISLPYPYGSDFLDVQIGEALPPTEDESDWKSTYLGSAAKGVKKQVRICRKLGYGRNGSVWMGYEEPEEPGSKRNYVAAKVFSLEASVEATCVNEISASARLGPLPRSTTAFSTSFYGTPSKDGQPPPHPGAFHIVKPYWHVMMEQSVHPQLDISVERLMSVMELCGPSLWLFMESSPAQTVPFPVWKNVFRDILMALDYLHTEKRMVHGDLKPGDFLAALLPLQTGPSPAGIEFEQPYYDHRDENDLPVSTVVFSKDIYVRDPEEQGSVVKAVREPISSPAVQSDWAVKPEEYEDGTVTILQANEGIKWKLSDFGSARSIPVQGQNPSLSTNVRRQAPELLLGLPWDEKVDIWALGTVMLDVLTNGYTFRGPLDAEIKHEMKPEALPNLHPFAWEISEVLSEYEEHNKADHLATMLVYSSQTGRFPKWMVDAHIAKVKDTNGAEEPLFDEKTGKLLRGKPVTSIPDDIRSMNTFNLPWIDLGPGGKGKDRLLVEVLMRTSIRIMRSRIHQLSPLEVNELLQAGDGEAEVAKKMDDGLHDHLEFLRDAVELIKRCLTLDPKERPSAKELLEEPIFDRSFDANVGLGDAVKGMR